MSLNPPSPPNPYTTAAAQEQVNQQSAKQQAELNNVNQTTPYGSLTYTQTGTNPDGTPIYSATTALNPAEENLFNTTVKTQQGTADAANALIKNLGSTLSTPPNLGNDALTNTMMGWQEKYMQPIFNQQESNLNSQLAAQGITQGSDAYNNAENLFSRNVNNAYEGAMTADEAQAYNQALQSYELPISTLSTLLGEGSPVSSIGTTSTPQESITSPNLQQAVQNTYTSQLQNYQNTMNGLFSLPAALAGGWAKAGFPT